MNVRKFVTLGTAWLLFVAVASMSCEAETATDPNIATLTAGGTAYIRMKEYSAKPMKDTTPNGEETKFQFGQAVKLIQEKTELPTLWLVSKDQTKAWIPAYVLTHNKAEIDFLKEKQRVPETMTFIYREDGDLKVWGIFDTGTFVVDSQGLVMQVYKEGTSPVAFKGNAVLFDESAVKEGPKKPLVFNKAKKPYQLSPTCMYYCVSEGDKPAFECIDLVYLKFRNPVVLATEQSTDKSDRLERFNRIARAAFEKKMADGGTLNDFNLTGISVAVNDANGQPLVMGAGWNAKVNGGQRSGQVQFKRNGNTWEVIGWMETQLGNDGKKEAPSGAQQQTGTNNKRIAEGRIQPLSKHGCVREITGFILLSKPTGQDIDEEVKKAIELAFDAQQNGKLLWVRMNVNINELFQKLHEQDPNVESFKKEDFLGLAGNTKVIPFAPDGIIEVNGYNRFLRQDLIFQLSDNVNDLEVIIKDISLAKFSLFPHDQ